MFPDFPEPGPRSADAVDADVMRAVSNDSNALPREILAAVRATANHVTGGKGVTEWDYFKRYGHREMRSAAVIDENEFIVKLARRAVEEGFRLAVERYAVQLKRVPELAAWHKKRAQGADKGRASQSVAKLKRSSQAQAMLNAGCDVGEIAKALQCSISTVYRAMSTTPPPPVKPARQRSRR